MYSNYKKIKDKEKNFERSQSGWRTYIYWRKDKNYICLQNHTSKKRVK